MTRKTWVLVSLLAAVPGCNKSDHDSPASEPKPPTLRVEALLRQDNLQNVHVFRDDIPENAAVVRVNGEVIPLDSDYGFYAGAMKTTPDAGDGMLLEVLSGDLEVIGTGTVPQPPVAEVTITIEGDASVSWTTPLSPAWFEVTAYSSDGSGSWVHQRVDGTARSATLPRASLPAGPSLTFYVEAFTEGRLGGDVSSGVGFLHVSSQSAHVYVTR